MRRLFGFGQVIASAIPIPGAAHLTDRSEASPSLSILRDDSEGMESEPAAGFSRDGDALRLTVPGVATYRCRARAITVAPCPSAAPTDLSELLVASALPAALWMQGRLVLHAAAVCTHAGGRALGLMGRSGSGKSTLAAGLVARGALLLADDSIAIAGGSGDLIASGLPGGLFLRGGDASRQFCPLAQHQTIDAAPLGALILLDSAAAEARLTRLSPNRAIEAVLSHRHRPRAPDLLGMRAKALLDSIGLARSIPVYAWGRPNAMLGAGLDETALLVRALSEENLGS
jgi:hypothetical protein